MRLWALRRRVGRSEKMIEVMQPLRSCVLTFALWHPEWTVSLCRGTELARFLCPLPGNWQAQC